MLITGPGVAVSYSDVLRIDTSGGSIGPSALGDSSTIWCLLDFLVLLGFLPVGFCIYDFICWYWSRLSSAIAISLRLMRFGKGDDIGESACASVLFLLTDLELRYIKLSVFLWCELGPVVLWASTKPEISRLHKKEKTLRKCNSQIFTRKNSLWTVLWLGLEPLHSCIGWQAETCSIHASRAHLAPDFGSMLDLTGVHHAWAVQVTIAVDFLKRWKYWHLLPLPLASNSYVHW